MAYMPLHEKPNGRAGKRVLIGEALDAAEERGVNSKNWRVGEDVLRGRAP
jgi:hypothetical protein